MGEFGDELAERFEQAGTTTEMARETAELAAAFRDDYEDAELTVDLFAKRVVEGPYGEFQRQWNWAVGDIAADIEDCTDTRAYRLAGFGEVGATGAW